MKGGVIIVSVGLFLLYLGLSGHYRPFVRAFREVAGLDDAATIAGASGPAITPQQMTYADLLRPLEIPGVRQEPYGSCSGVFECQPGGNIPRSTDFPVR